MDSLLRVALDLVNVPTLWTKNGPWQVTLAKLLSIMDGLVKHEPLFSVVDSNVPFEVRAERLLAWCKTHPHFSCGFISLSASMEGKPIGSRGVLCTELLPPGAPIVCVPTELALSTDSAYVSHELGPLLDQPSPILSSMPPLILTLHVLVEHAKALDTPPLPPSQPLPPATLPVGRPPALMAHHAATLRTLNGKPSGTALHPQDHPWGSKFRAFLACLPKRTSNCLFWSHASFLKLSHTRIAYPAACLVRDAVKAFLTLRDSVVGRVEGLGRHFTWAAFRWALSVCMSLQNELPSPHGTPKPPPFAGTRGGSLGAFSGGVLSAFNTLGILPIFEMMSHSERGDTPHFITFDAIDTTASAVSPTPLLGSGRVTCAAILSSTEGSLHPGSEVCRNFGVCKALDSLMFRGSHTPADLEREGLSITFIDPSSYAQTKPLLSLTTGILEALGVGFTAEGQPLHASQHIAELAASKGEAVEAFLGKLTGAEKSKLSLVFVLKPQYMEEVEEEGVDGGGSGGEGGSGGGDGGYGHSHGPGHSHGGGGEEGDGGARGMGCVACLNSSPSFHTYFSVLPPQLFTFARVMCLIQKDLLKAIEGRNIALGAMEDAVAAAVAAGEGEGGLEGDEGEGDGEGGHSHGGVPCTEHHAPSVDYVWREYAKLVMPRLSDANEAAAMAMLESHLFPMLVKAEERVARMSVVVVAEDFYIRLLFESHVVLLKQALDEVRGGL